jgi:hypothetical protein
MLDMIGGVVAGDRKIFQFSDKERDASMLVLKLGGPKLLHAVSRAQGLPNLSVTKERARCATFSVKDVFDLATLQLNLNAFSEIMADFDLVPCSVMVDEIALERGVRYDAKNNQMVGLCAEHVGQPEPQTAYTQIVP